MAKLIVQGKSVDLSGGALVLPSISGGGVSVKSIAIVSPPYKTNYYADETFDPTGMVVYADFSNGHTLYINHEYLTFNPGEGLALGDTSVTINFKWGDKTVSADQPISVASVFVFGVVWDYSDSSSALTRLTPETDPYHFVTTSITSEPVPAVADGPGSSPFDNYMPWSGMTQYNIDATGKILYQKGGAGFSYTNYETIVYIPEFWYTSLDDEENQKRYWYISDKELEEFETHPGSDKYIARYKVDSSCRSSSGGVFKSKLTVNQAITNCAQRGSNFYLSDIKIWSAIRILYLVEFADWNSQVKIGNGVYADYIPVGSTDAMTYHTGKVSDETEWPQIQYRGIEGIYGNAIEIVQGLKCPGLMYQVSIDNVTYTDVYKIPQNLTTDHVVSSLYYDRNHKWLFLPDEGGTTNPLTYLTDGASITTNSRDDWYICLGGHKGMELFGGLFAHYSSDGNSANYGFRYAVNPTRE